MEEAQTQDQNNVEMHEIESPPPQPQVPAMITDEEKKMSKGILGMLMFQSKGSLLAMIPCVLIGAAPLVAFLLFGRILNLISKYYMEIQQNQTPKDVMHDIGMNCIYICIVSVLSGILKYLQTFTYIRIGANMSKNIKSSLFKSIACSDITFFDTSSVGSLMTMISEDVQMIEDAYGTAKGAQIENLARFLIGVILAFVYSWKMALVTCAAIPFCVLTMFLFTPLITKHSITKFLLTAKSTTITQEVFSSMQTVRGYNKEDFESQRYKAINIETAKIEKKVGFVIAGMFTIAMIIVWTDVVANMYFGATLVQKSINNGDKKLFLAGDMISCFMFIMFATMGIMTAQGAASGDAKAIEAYARILKVVMRQPAINFEDGIEPEVFNGKIEFKNVTFKYPTRNVEVLKNVSFVAEPNKTTALVGHSGSGKSTCIQLIERFYDVTEGQILIDDKDIKEYNPRWLHKKIGLISQDIFLFSRSIKENISYGKKDASNDEILTAIESANAKSFINKKPEKMDTVISENGQSLSGSQRQRILIARAILKSPSILLCDEATSALDVKSENKVQAALTNIMRERTSIVVAHRLSTIKNANSIFVFDNGSIVESGDHNSLIEKKGTYYNLFSRQLTKD